MRRINREGRCKDQTTWMMIRDLWRRGHYTDTGRSRWRIAAAAGSSSSTTRGRCSFDCARRPRRSSIPYLSLCQSEGAGQFRPLGQRQVLGPLEPALQLLDLQWGIYGSGFPHLLPFAIDPRQFSVLDALLDVHCAETKMNGRNKENYYNSRIFRSYACFWNKFFFYLVEPIYTFYIFMFRK